MSYTLHMCCWDFCIETFPSNERLNTHVIHEHVRKSQAISLSQFQDFRRANGSVVSDEVSYSFDMDYTQSQTRPPKSKKRKLSPLQEHLPSPPKSTPPHTPSSPMNDAHTPTFASLASREPSPVFDVPMSPTFQALVSAPQASPFHPESNPASQDSSSTSNSLDAVEAHLTQEEDDDDDAAYRNELTWSSSGLQSSPGSRRNFPSSTVSPLDTIRPRSSSRRPQAPSSQPSDSVTESQENFWDQIPSASQIPPLYTQAPYQSQQSQDL